MSIASNQVPYDRVESIAKEWAASQWSDMSLAKVLTYYSFDGEVNGYAFIFALENLPPDGILLQEILSVRGEKPRNRYGVDRFATIVMSSRYDEVPIFQYYRGLPGVYSIRRYLPERFDHLQPIKVYYYAPMAEWIEFDTPEGRVLVDGYSARIHKRDEFVEDFIGHPAVDSKERSITKKMWLELSEQRVARQDSNVIPGMVPFYEWHYGCSPTASAMLCGYWDPQNYARLVDFFFGPMWSNPEGQWDDGIPNIQRELALAMGTETLNSGGTSIYAIASGQLSVCNGTNGYSFQSTMYGPGTQSNPYVTWNVITAQVDAGRPLHWAVLSYQGGSINHSLTGVGYKITGGQRYVYVNTTWYENEEWWAQHTSGSRDYAYTLIPGGGIDCDLDLTYPRTRAQMFRNIKYRIKWWTRGSHTIDQLNIYYHTGYNSNTWTTLATGVPNNGAWIWTVPNDTIEARIALRGYDNSAVLVAADGESLAFVTRTYEHSNELVLVGHYDTDGTSKRVLLSSDYLYTADDNNGIVIFDVSDSSLPDERGSLDLPSAVAVALKGADLFVASEDDTVFSVDVTDPANPTQQGFWAAPDHCYNLVRYQDNYLIVACRTAGVVVLDISDPTNPSQYSVYDTPGTAYGLDIVGNYLFVADGTQGMRIIDLSDLQNLTEIGYYDPIGVAKEVAARGNRAYLINGGLGITIIDISDPQNPQELGTIDTPGTATWAKAVSVTHLFVGDGGSGLRVYDVTDPGNPTEVGYLDSHGEAAGMAFNGDLIYLADGGDGVYIIHSSLIGVEEESAKGVVTFFIPNLIRDRMVITGAVPVASNLEVEISDVLGRNVETFAVNVNGKFTINHPLSLSAGIYFVRVSGAGKVVTAKTVVVK